MQSIPDKTENGFSRNSVLNDFRLAKDQAVYDGKSAEKLIADECTESEYQETLDDLNNSKCRTEQPVIPGYFNS